MSSTFTGTAELINSLQDGSLSSRQLTERCLRRIEVCNPQLNAFLYVNAESALKQADEIDQRRKAGGRIGRLNGIPVALKDNICTQDVPTTCGSRMLQNFVPPYDAHVAQ